ncbi:probable D-lactate dehydrogenase, mitochondrial [Uloborus diversus]|uniref:probable D-lactate dehydrogenase, mitochondrial n=1 Tax=Uloborus diversus TaxID=327109 RepID=UPI002409CC44|nr:probable D-lactate dehydrogenase, mitochondrial [Uloborus diversus]XP_054724971.1 probable D-lactate dehydrogenase, mitochondrial [Uloborus diversus]XP_054724972.1 probable D-lactate dehydrogenase, mitochondrial [Uloborus diversus]
MALMKATTGALHPMLLFFPQCNKHICEVVHLCQSFNVPIIPHGTGTGLEHGIGAIMGGVCINLSNLSSIVEVNEDDFDCTVEAGVTRKTLNEYLKRTGLMFPVDPGADASLGGMVATSASGTNAMHYGTMKHNVLNLEVVLADGSILHTSGPQMRARKSSAGYNLTELFVGSEGTLGIITKVTLRLHAIPEMMVSAISSFSSVENAVNAAVQMLQCSIPVAKMELLDELSMEISNNYSNLNYPVTPCLFLEFHGSEKSIKAEIEQVEEVIRENHGGNIIWADNLEQRNLIWKARHQIYYATLAQKPGHKCVVTDVCVPISKLTKIISETKKDIDASGILGTIIGHVGDGNFHTQLLFDPKNEREFEIAHQLEDRISKRALSLNGTCTGEHGIGIGKMSFLEQEYGDVGLKTMQSIKRILDPKNIMNPGKVIKLPEEKNAC